MIRKIATTLLFCAAFVLSTVVMAKEHQDVGWNLISILAALTGSLSFAGIVIVLFVED